MASTEFDPRTAALTHAGAAASLASKCERRDAMDVVAESANAIVCGLVYLGDELAKMLLLLGLEISNASGDTADRSVASIKERLAHR